MCFVLENIQDGHLNLKRIDTITVKKHDERKLLPTPRRNWA